jgi:hypothetical protein
MILTDEQLESLLSTARNDRLPHAWRKALREAHEDAMTWGEADLSEFDPPDALLSWVRGELTV